MAGKLVLDYLSTLYSQGRRLRDFRPFWPAWNGPGIPSLDRAIELRKRAESVEGFSKLTTDTFYADLFRYILKRRKRGLGIIEVGCFHGGTSILLAYVCQEFGWPLHLVDISQECLDFTTKLLDTLGLKPQVFPYRGTLEQFAGETELAVRPALIFIDGDHSYDGVKADCSSIYRLNQLPHAAAFHDFGLRSKNPQHGTILVDKAIYDSFGHDLAFRRIGAENGPNPRWTENQPNSLGIYEEPNSCEGIIIELEGRRLRVAS